MIDIKALAARLDAAEQNARAIPQLAEPLSLDEAYLVQSSLLARRYRRGEKRIGVKMGFTSHAKMAQMGIDDVIWGRLSDGMLVANGGSIDFAAFVHPRVEPEIAFLLAHDLPETVTPEAARAGLAGVAPALEIIDSRYENFKFSLTDVVADNSSSSAFVVGPWFAPETDLNDLGMVLQINGSSRQTGSSAAILGHPIHSLIAAARLAARAGEPLKAGDIVMAGGATAAEYLAPGDHAAVEVHTLGRAEFHVR